MKRILHFRTFLCLILSLGITGAWAQTTFSYTGGVQTYVVSPGITTILVEMAGGDGYGTIGEGGLVEAIIPVTPGETLNIYVGGEGTATTGGYNGGGTPGVNATYGGGGGASDVRVSPYGLANRIAVAGGGGGSGSNCGTFTAEGGHGGGLVAESACLYSCSDCQYTGGGGTQVSGGIAGPTGHGSCGGNTNGSFGQGGNNTGAFGTGGGGGYYGGGSGCFEGAGGGSSYTHPLATDVIHTIGGNVGHGYVIITELCMGLELTVTDYALCIGESFTATATSVDGGVIVWDGGLINGVEYTPLTPGLYTFNATSSNPDDCGAQIEILVNEYPTVTAGVTDSDICDGQSVVFAGGGAATYTWDMGVTNGVPFTPGGLGTVTYTVIGEDEAGCDGTASVDVTVSPVPVVDASVSETEICEGETIIFTKTGDADSYSWDPADIVEGIPYAPADGVSTYTLTGTFDDTGCSTEDVITITLNPTPTVTASAGDGIFCLNESVVLASGGDADIYVWDPTDLTPGLGTHTYTLTGIYEGIEGCPASASVTVTVLPVPVITASADFENVCLGQEVTLTATGSDSYNWSPEGIENGVGFVPGPIGSYTYTVVGTSSGGCSSAASTVTVNVVEGITLSFDITPVMFGADGEINMTVSGGVPPYTFEWQKGGAFYDDTEDLTGLSFGAYDVTVTGASGCTAHAIKYVQSTVGVEEFDDLNAQVYPNPTTDNISIVVDGLFQYEILSINGEVLLSGSATDKMEVSLGNFADGIYFVRLQTENNSTVLKVEKH